MSSFTRKAIIEAFVKLLNERPLNKITIKDIVEECGINRNTFYYHFRDVPDLIEAIVHEETELVISQNTSVESFEDCLEIAVQFILKNRRANLHIFNSTSRDMYEQHLMQLCRYVVETFLKREFDARRICPEDREALVMGYASQAFGLFISWLDGGLTEDFHQKLSRLCELRHGSIEAALSRCRTQ